MWICVEFQGSPLPNSREHVKPGFHTEPHETARFHAAPRGSRGGVIRPPIACRLWPQFRDRVLAGVSCMLVLPSSRSYPVLLRSWRLVECMRRLLRFDKGVRVLLRFVRFEPELIVEVLAFLE